MIRARGAEPTMTSEEPSSVLNCSERSWICKWVFVGGEGLDKCGGRRGLEVRVCERGKRDWMG